MGCCQGPTREPDSSYGLLSVVSEQFSDLSLNSPPRDTPGSFAEVARVSLDVLKAFDQSASPRLPFSLESTLQSNRGGFTGDSKELASPENLHY